MAIPEYERLRKRLAATRSRIFTFTSVKLIQIYDLLNLTTMGNSAAIMSAICREKITVLPAPVGSTANGRFPAASAATTRAMISAWYGRRTFLVTDGE